MVALKTLLTFCETFSQYASSAVGTILSLPSQFVSCAFRIDMYVVSFSLWLVKCQIVVTWYYILVLRENWDVRTIGILTLRKHLFHQYESAWSLSWPCGRLNKKFFFNCHSAYGRLVHGLYTVVKTLCWFFVLFNEDFLSHAFHTWHVFEKRNLYSFTINAVSFKQVYFQAKQIQFRRRHVSW